MIAVANNAKAKIEVKVELDRPTMLLAGRKGRFCEWVG